MKRPQFSLRTLSIAVTLIAVVLATIFAGVHVRQEKIRRAEIETLEWSIAHPNEWEANGSQSQFLDDMKKRLAELKQ